MATADTNTLINNFLEKLLLNSTWNFPLANIVINYFECYLNFIS